MAAVGVAAATRDPIVGRLSGVVYEKIVEMIANGTFPVNSRLPAESELSSRFDASRPVVREALQESPSPRPGPQIR